MPGVLMSGGFDSTVAAYQMMRRGMISHFVFFNLGGRAHELGVMEVAHYLWEKYGRSQRVLFVSVPFEEVVGEILTRSTVRWVARSRARSSTAMSNFDSSCSTR